MGPMPLTVAAALAFTAVSATFTFAQPPASPPSRRATSCGGLGDANDWLVAGCDTRSAVTRRQLPDGSTSFEMSNGIVSRTLVANKSTGLLGTTSIATLGGGRVEKIHWGRAAGDTI